MIRLRQIALVARDLDPVVADLRAVLGLEVAYRDPVVADFGLHNAVMPAGHQFIEVVAPTRDGTAARRYLERRGGEGGYMVILQCDDHGPVKARVDALGVRKVIEQDTDHYRLMQLHPRDTGASFLEIDVQVGGEAIDGPWEPAGPDWHAARTDTVTAITAAEIQAEDPAAVATRWAELLGLPIDATDDNAPVVHLDNAALRFVPAADGRGEGLAGIDLGVIAPADVIAAAERRHLPVSGDTVTIGGVRIRLHGEVGRRVP
jgi:catechol 2,3-dioxygenase-like lactoylglutathione lyase family enzyme